MIKSDLRVHFLNNYYYLTCILIAHRHCLQETHTMAKLKNVNVLSIMQLRLVLLLRLALPKDESVDCQTI